MIFVKISQSFIKTPLKFWIISQISVYSLYGMCELLFCCTFENQPSNKVCCILVKLQYSCRSLACFFSITVENSVDPDQIGTVFYKICYLFSDVITIK